LDGNESDIGAVSEQNAAARPGAAGGQRGGRLDNANGRAILVFVTKGEETRQRIVDRALELASASGIEGITLGVLAESLTLSKSGLFAHFRSREALQIAVLEEAAERFTQGVIVPALRAPRGEPRIRALVDKWVEWGRARFLPGGCVFVSAAVELDDRPGPVRDVLVRIQKDWLATLAQAVRTAIEEKHFREDLEPEQFAFEMHGLVLAYHHAGRLLGDPRALDRARVGFEGLIDRARAKKR
jgi:AcrR family transcriptional regulator